MTTQKKSDVSLLGAYPIKNWLECAERTRKDTSYNPELMAPNPPALQERMDSGNVFESSIYSLILKIRKANKKLPWEFCVIEEDNDRSLEGKKRAESETLKALARGAHVIWNARISSVEEGIIGVPDLLVREDWSDDASLPYSYLGVDIKEHMNFEGESHKGRIWEASTLKNPNPAQTEEFVGKGTPNKKDTLQLAHYWKLLNSVGHAGSKKGGILGKEGVIIWRDLEEAFYKLDTPAGSKFISAWELYEFALKGTVNAISHEKQRVIDEATQPLSGPEWKTACHECPWREVCHEELVETNHITLLAGLTPKRAQAHYSADVHTVKELANLNRETALLIDAKIDLVTILEQAEGLVGETAIAAIPKIKPKALKLLTEAGYTTVKELRKLDKKTVQYSESKVFRLAEAIDQARVKTTNRVHRARNVDFVSIPRTAVEWDVDIEDAPYLEGQNLCYLIGVRETLRSRGEVKTVFHSFVDWSGTEEGEARVFAEFWQAMVARKEWAKTQRVGGFTCYVYSEHEARFFLSLSKKYAGYKGVPTSEEVRAAMETDGQGRPVNSGYFVDMYPILAKQLIWPTESLSIKSLAKLVMFVWRDETPGGANSVAWYREALRPDTDPELAESLKKRLIEYNEDDVTATYIVRDWIGRFGETRKPGEKLPSIEDLDKKFNRKRLALVKN